MERDVYKMQFPVRDQILISDENLITEKKGKETRQDQG